MQVAWSRDLKGYLIYSVSTGPIPKTIYNKPLIGIYDSSFNNSDSGHDPVSRLLRLFFQKELRNTSTYQRRVGELGHGGLVYGYYRYGIDLLENRLRIESACKAELYYQEEFVIRSCLEVKFDNRIVYRDKDMHFESDHIHSEVSEYALFLSKKLTRLLWFIAEYYGINERLLREIVKRVDNSVDKRYSEIYLSRFFEKKNLEEDIGHITFVDESQCNEFYKPRILNGQINSAYEMIKEPFLHCWISDNDD